MVGGIIPLRRATSSRYDGRLGQESATSHEDPLFSEAAEETFDELRARILQLEQEAEAQRH